MSCDRAGRLADLEIGQYLLDRTAGVRWTGHTVRVINSVEKLMSTTTAPMSDLVSAARSWRGDGRDRLIVHAVITCLSFVAYILGRVLDGPIALVLVAIGASACGWAWLLARALFDQARHDTVWPRAVVAVVAISGAVSVLGSDAGLVQRIVGNLYALSGSAALLMTLVEPFQAHGCKPTSQEKRFRALFVVGFGLLAGVSVLGVWLRPEPIQVASASLGLGAALAATVFRIGHPLQPQEGRPQRRATDEDRRLGERLTGLLQDEAVFADPDLRISDLAIRLGEPEHRVSRCISAALGFPNFNRLINHHRIALASHLLAAPTERRSILEIALDCGFGSIGPFNRAFKAETGITPRAYRAAMAGGPTADPASPAPAA